MIIQIALGIVLAVLILAYFQEIIALGLILVAIVVAVAALAGLVYFINSLRPERPQKTQSAPPAITPAVVSPAIQINVPPAQTRAKKKYPLVFSSGQIYEIEAPEDATAQELQAEVKRVVNGIGAWMDVVGTDDGATVYADLGTFVKVGQVVKMTWLMDFQASRRPPKNHSSARMMIEHDCSDRQMQIFFTQQYHNYMGRPGASRVVSQLPARSPVPSDGGQLDRMWSFACR